MQSLKVSATGGHPSLFGNLHTMPPPKHLAECTVLLCTSNVLMLTPNQLDGKELPPHIAEHKDDFHIYAIARRPAISLVPDTLSHDDTVLSGVLRFRIAGVDHQSAFRFPCELPPDTMVRVSGYPFRKIEMVDDLDQTVFTIQSWLLPFLSTQPDPNLTNLEVVYVGQAFGDGNRSAFDRLNSHSTLQKILADCNAKRPDDEIIILMFKYELNGVISMFSPEIRADADVEADMDHWVNIHENPIPEKNQISIAEAALIRYFQPYYNSHFREQFPAERQKLLQECYALDFSALTVEINTEDVGARIFSPTRSAGVHHIASFDLHDIEKRRSFFASFDPTATAALNSGPLF